MAVMTIDIAKESSVQQVLESLSRDGSSSGGAVKSIQKGFLGFTNYATTELVGKYYYKYQDVTVSAVDTAKCICITQAGGSSYVSTTWRLVNSTTLRLLSASGDTYPTVIWTLVEFA